MADIYDAGYSSSLSRNSLSLDNGDSLMASNQSNTVYSAALSGTVEGELSATNLGSGSFASVLFAGKDTFSSTTVGYRMGIDLDDKYKWVIGDSTNHIDWNVTTANTLTITGALSASTITGGTIQTSTSGYRIRMVDTDPGTPNQSDDTLAVIDDSNRLVLRLGGSNAAGGIIDMNLYVARSGLQINLDESDYWDSHLMNRPFIDLTNDEYFYNGTYGVNSTLLRLNNYAGKGSHTAPTFVINSGTSTAVPTSVKSLQITHYGSYNSGAAFESYIYNDSSGDGHRFQYEGAGGSTLRLQQIGNVLGNSGAVLSLSQYRIIAGSGSGSFRRMITLQGITFWYGGGTTPHGNLTSDSSGDVCFRGDSGKVYYAATGGSTTWTAM